MTATYPVADPVRLVASSVFRMPACGEGNGSGREVVGREAIPFFVVEMLPGEYWLYRKDGDCCNSYGPFRARLERGELSLANAPYFRRIAWPDAPVAGIDTEMGSNDPIDVILRAPGREPQRLNAPLEFVGER